MSAYKVAIVAYVMRQNKHMAAGGTRNAGFTIIETLIVLAVSAGVAASTLLLVSGKQNETEFRVAVNGMKQKIEQVINETRSGYYPSNNNFTCNVSLTITATANQQGTNTDCIFLGKAIEFGIGPSGAGSYATYPLIGKRVVTAAGVTRAVQSFTEAGVKPLAFGAAGATATMAVDASSVGKTQNGLTLKTATYHYTSGPDATAAYAVLAFANDLSRYTMTTNGLNSATQKLDLYDFRPTAWIPAPMTSAGVVDMMNAHPVNEATPKLKSVDLCYDGGSGKSGLITITGLGQLTVSLQIFNGNSCS